MIPRAAIAALLLCWTAACSAGEPVKRDRPQELKNLPAGAVKRGPDSYLVPIERDREGCMMYRTYSRHRLVPQVIYYNDGKGGFTANRDAAVCNLK